MTPILLLAVCQAALMMGQSLTLVVAPAATLAMTGSAWLATSAIGVQFAATLLTVFPAAALMRRHGRRAGFVTGALAGMAGSAVAAVALHRGSFWMFCVGLSLHGVLHGFATYYRFAAFDAASDRHRNKAAPSVLFGGAAAAFAGPAFANWMVDAPGAAAFAPTYAALLGVQALALLALWPLRLQAPAPRAASRPWRQIVGRSAFVVPAFAAVAAFGTMNLLMTAVPLALHARHHSFADTAFVIQWHLLGMFVPALACGALVARWGATPVMAAGAALIGACAAINTLSQSLWATWSAMTCLGVGWNFLFLGSTALLAIGHAPQDRPACEALNDFLVLFTMTLTALGAGGMSALWGWQALNAGVIAAAAAVIAAIAWLRARHGDPTLPAPLAASPSS